MKECDQNLDLHLNEVHGNAVNVEQYEVNVEYSHRLHHYITERKKLINPYFL